MPGQTNPPFIYSGSEPYSDLEDNESNFDTGNMNWVLLSWEKKSSHVLISIISICSCNGSLKVSFQSLPVNFSPFC